MFDPLTMLICGVLLAITAVWFACRPVRPTDPFYV